jgi:hypothetical protein
MEREKAIERRMKGMSEECGRKEGRRLSSDVQSNGRKRARDLDTKEFISRWTFGLFTLVL